ncbi:substance-P receptor-like [Convolutriloba macropyga]|uniref:substance-P receptor-like n=1 Tax=Convolutriloba macropyga TaxID=536237 RepID=UPI003F524C25
MDQASADPIDVLNATVGSPDDFLLSKWQIVAAYIAFSILILVALIGNSIMIWLILSNKSLRTHTNYFILNLAFSDVLVTLFKHCNPGCVQYPL